MNNTLTDFDWNDKGDRAWLTEYFLDSTRKLKSDISIPNIKGTREAKSQELFELFFEKLQGGTEHDKKIRKNVMSAWRKKLKQRKNHKQINIELTSDEYDKLISLKDLKELEGKKATIKDTILDLIYNEYGEHQDIRQELEKELRKEITQEMRKKARAEVPKRSVKSPVEIESISNNHQAEQIEDKAQVESQIIAKIEALNNDTNARFEKLESMLSGLIIPQEQHNIDAPLKLELVTKTFTESNANTVIDAINRIHKTIKYNKIDPKSHTVLSSWIKKNEIDVSEEEALHAKKWHTEWVNKSQETKNKCNIIDELKNINAPESVKAIIITHATNIYNELLKFYLQTDVQICNIANEWENIESLIHKSKGDKWLKPLSTMNNHFKQLMTSYFNTIDVSTEIESYGAFSTGSISITLTDYHILALVPWSLSTIGLTSCDLSNTLSITNSKHSALTEVDKVVRDIMKKSEKVKTNDIQILTANDELINIGISMFEPESYFLYIDPAIDSKMN
ncbi:MULTISPECIES: hypothetical protein [Aliivibrio]|uniref:Uncharacterized protein n=1 Tax=Aliivibrio finisterrensis TaxID=511998 RepID=A0A4V1Z7J4_9GAMM|nr:MULTISPECIES: hypothetical protein [Aliivibrio]MDD9176301.1 hypothetical protein [Aliivibrio sp. S3TY1]MDD9177919.1 hypothetical protein [Aliivibrio sp. A6]MDD9193320.1 hypothetical protein [Aliivibrio sp. S2TY2]RYU45533.1 hypothetical protein ERW49_13515 [Aliivibrio finisterrensis]RYU52263.1 hypothetical protein ERW57_07140 [Aliivibrio finisterrensis]